MQGTAIEGEIIEADLPPPDPTEPFRPLRLTLDDCVQMVLERGLLIKSAGMEIEAAHRQLKEADAEFWPVVEYKYRAAPVPTDASDAFNSFFDGQLTMFNSIHVGIGYPLFTFGQLSTARKIARGGVAAAKLDRQKAREQAVYEVKKIYYGILLANETIKLLDDAVNKMTKRIDEEEGREMPEMNPYDLLQLKAFKLELERRLEEAQNNRALAYEGLRLQLDLEPGTEVQLADSTLTPETVALEQQRAFLDAHEEREEDLQRLDIGVQAKALQYRLEKFKMLPKLGLGFFVDVGRTVHDINNLQATDDFSNPFNYTRAGVGLELKGNLDFHGSYQRIKRARAEYFKASYDRAIARRAKDLDMRKAYLEARRARANVGRSKKEQSLANQMMFLTRLNLDTGVGSQEDYADALKALLVARGRYFKSIFDYNVALADLERRVGTEEYSRLTPEVNRAFYDVFDRDRGSDDDVFESEEPYGLEEFDEELDEEMGE